MTLLPNIQPAENEGLVRVPGHGSTRTKAGRCAVGRRIVIQFDDDTFAELRQRALDGNRSMAAVIREAVEWGLMDLAEAGAR